MCRFIVQDFGLKRLSVRMENMDECVYNSLHVKIVTVETPESLEPVIGLYWELLEITVGLSSIRTSLTQSISLAGCRVNCELNMLYRVPRSLR